MTQVPPEGHRLPPGLSATHPAALLATWFGSGLLPWAPGTWGSLCALPFAALLHYQFNEIGLAVAAVIVFVIGWLASNVYIEANRAAEIHDADPKAIVVDEVAGQWLTLAVAPLDPMMFALGFVLFRFFDIVKPWPANMIDKHIKSGLGIMLDDIVAGIYASAVLLLIRIFAGVN